MLSVRGGGISPGWAWFGVWIGGAWVRIILTVWNGLRQDREASQTRGYCVAKNAKLRAVRPGPSAGKERPPQDDKLRRRSGAEACSFPFGLRPKSITLAGAVTWRAGNRDAIIAAKALFLRLRGVIQVSPRFAGGCGKVCLPGEDFVDEECE